jgi:hypothetical protein
MRKEARIIKTYRLRGIEHTKEHPRLVGLPYRGNNGMSKRTMLMRRCFRFTSCAVSSNLKIVRREQKGQNMRLFDCLRDGTRPLDDDSNLSRGTYSKSSPVSRIRYTTCASTTVTTLLPLLHRTCATHPVHSNRMVFLSVLFL